MQQLIASVGTILSDYILVTVLLLTAIYFTITTRGVQFRMIGEMFRLLIHSGKRDESSKADDNSTVSSFQAFSLSIASRVGTGNMAGVATAIALGGPGAVFWMWVIALLGAATAFIESTLAQLFKVRGAKSFMGGPAYYIQKGLGNRPWAICFALLITITFGFAFNSVQANTIASAFNQSFEISPLVTGSVLTIATFIIISGGIQRVSRFSEIVVPVMALAYLLLAIVIIGLNLNKMPQVMTMILTDAFNLNSAMAGTIGMGLIMGIKRGLFSNEAGEGSTPNAAATANVSHPVKQGLIQALGVYTDTLVVCSCTAFIILCSGVWGGGTDDGIVLTQKAIDADLGSGHNFGSIFVSIAILFFAFTSIVANYYYGETNLRFIRNSPGMITIYRLMVCALVMTGSLTTLNIVWGFADITMALMTLCNLGAIILLAKYAITLLADYTRQRRDGKNPVYTSDTLPQIKHLTECWSEKSSDDDANLTEIK